jgi:hypothetical protein
MNRSVTSQSVEDEKELPANLSLIERLDNAIPSAEGDLLPFLKYLRSRLLPGRDVPAHLEPGVLMLLGVSPGSISCTVLSYLKAYMDEHPESFSRIEIT